MSAVIAYRNERHQKFCQIVLDSSEQVVVRMDESGLTIERLTNARAPAALLFHADADRATSIAMGLASEDQARQGKILDVLVAIVAKLGSSEKIAAAFKDAAKAVR